MAENKTAKTDKSNDSTKPAVNFGGGRTDNHGIVEKAGDVKGTLKRLIKYFGSFKGLFALLIVFVVFYTVTAVFIPSLEGNAIDSINDKQFSNVILLIIWLLVMFVIQAVATLFQTRISARLSLLITKKMRSDLFRHINHLPVSYLDTHSNGDILSRMTNDVENISSTLSTSMSSFISAVLTILGTLTVILIYSWQLTLITMFTVFLTVFSTKKLSKIMAVQFRKKAATNGALNGLTQEMVTNYKSVVAYNRQDSVIKEYNAKAEELRSVGIKAESLSNGVGPVLDCISNIGFVIVAVFGGIFACNGMITIGVVSAFIVYAKQFIRPVNEVAQIYGSIQTAIAGAERVFTMMDEPVEDFESGNAESEGAGSIEFEHVNFSYTPEKQVLHDFSLSIRPNSKIALVGATGSGKTTVTNLLDRFYDADSGSISIDGVSIYDMNLADLRKNIAIVLQDTVLFSGTIAENIKYSNESASDEQMKQAALISNCSGFIEKLPEGYNTKLVRGGSNLSRGQQQLIAIARAVLADPKILILDEATSSVDTKTEKQIQDAMVNLMKNRTSLIIAHRLSTIQDADLIVVLDNGRIAEQGSHDELIAKRGLYYELYMTQFAGGVI